MKKVTLNFREVAVDGLPEKSMDTVALREYSNGEIHPWVLPFSAHYQGFNMHDSYSAREHEIDGITHWMPLDEFNAAMKKAKRVKQHA